MPNSPFPQRAAKLADSLCEDLQDDTELQLDVCEELRTHLLDAYDSAVEYCDTEQQAEEQALEHFGPSGELPQMLVQGNLKRMTLRSRIKWILTYAFIPLVVLLAFGLGWREWREFIELQVNWNDSPISSSSHKSLLRVLEKRGPIDNLNELTKQAEKAISRQWFCRHVMDSQKS